MISYSTFLSNKPGILNIVDLSKIVLERSTSAREGILTMGELAEKYGYQDNAESLLVTDKNEAYIFHILESSQPIGAVWAAQKVPDGHIAAVTNGFTIREIDFQDPSSFLFSENMVSEAIAAGFYHPSSSPSFDFTKVFGGGGSGPQYAVGRRMWRIYSLLSPLSDLPSIYEDYVAASPYPATLPVQPSTVNKSLVFRTMRDFYAGTKYALNQGMAGGYAGTPTRWSPGPGEQEVHGRWERPISLYRSQISFVIEMPPRSSSPTELSSPPPPILHFSPNAAHAGTYTPLSPMMSRLPDSVTNATSWGAIERWSLAWATRYLFNIMQMRFDRMYEDFSAAREAFEADTDEILQNQVLGGGEKRSQDEAGTEPSSVVLDAATSMDTILSSRADEAVKWLWSQSDVLFAKYANNGGGPAGYPEWWLSSPEVRYETPRNESDQDGDGAAPPDGAGYVSAAETGPPRAAQTKEMDVKKEPGSVLRHRAKRGSDMPSAPIDEGKNIGPFGISRMMIPQLRKYYRYFSATWMKMKRPFRGN